MAEASYVQVAPHNASGPIGTAAAVHLDAVIPNFLIQEFFVAQAPWIEDVVPGGPRVEGGEIVVPDRPGLGVDPDDAATRALPPQEHLGHVSLLDGAGPPLPAGRGGSAAGKGGGAPLRGRRA